MRTKKHYMWALFAVVLLLAAPVFPFGAEPDAQNPDTMKELLAEVRGLRAAMEQLASAGPRVQLMFGRLQLQEQRINDQMRKLDALRTQLTKSQDEEGRLRSQVARFEEFVRTSPPSYERKDLEDSLPQMKANLVRVSAETQRLQAEESNLASMISTEQNRWTDINRMVDELDRTLSRR